MQPPCKQPIEQPRQRATPPPAVRGPYRALVRPAPLGRRPSRRSVRWLGPGQASGPSQDDDLTPTPVPVLHDDLRPTAGRIVKIGRHPYGADQGRCLVRPRLGDLIQEPKIVRRQRNSQLGPLATARYTTASCPLTGRGSGRLRARASGGLDTLFESLEQIRLVLWIFGRILHRQASGGLDTLFERLEQVRQRVVWICGRILHRLSHLGLADQIIEGGRFLFGRQVSSPGGLGRARSNTYLDAPCRSRVLLRALLGPRHAGDRTAESRT